MALAVPHTLHTRGGSLGGNFAGGAFTVGHTVAPVTGGVGLCGMGGLAASSGPGRCASDLTLVSAPRPRVTGLGTGAAGLALGFAPWSSATERTLGSSPPGAEDTTESSASGSALGITTASLIGLGDGYTLPPSCVAGSWGCVSATATLTPAGGGNGAASIQEPAERTKLTAKASEGWLCVKTGCRPE